jgi:hypothetical protein
MFFPLSYTEDHSSHAYDGGGGEIKKPTTWEI